MLLKSLGHRIIPFTSSYISRKTRDGPVFLSCCTDLKAFHHSPCSVWNKRISIRVTTLAAAPNILFLRGLHSILCFSVMLSWALGATQATPVILHCTFPCPTPGYFLNSNCQGLGCLGNHCRTKETDFIDYMLLYSKLRLRSRQKDDHRKIQKDLALGIRGQFETGQMKQNMWGITDLRGLTLEPQWVAHGKCKGKQVSLNHHKSHLSQAMSCTLTATMAHLIRRNLLSYRSSVTDHSFILQVFRKLIQSHLRHFHRDVSKIPGQDRRQVLQSCVRLLLLYIYPKHPQTPGHHFCWYSDRHDLQMLQC